MLFLIHVNYLILNSAVVQRYWAPSVMYYAIMDYCDEIFDTHLLHGDMIEDRDFFQYTSINVFKCTVLFKEL